MAIWEGEKKAAKASRRKFTKAKPTLEKLEKALPKPKLTSLVEVSEEEEDSDGEDEDES